MLNKIINRFSYKRLCQKPKKQNGFIATTISAIASAVSFAVAFGATAIGLGSIAVGLGAAAGILAAGAVIFGGIALSMSLSGSKKNLSDGLSTSPTYASNVLQTQTNNQLPIPLIYGEVKLAGNRLWQNDGGESTIKRLVAFAEGEIEDFTDIRLNDIPYTEISGCTIEKFYGTSTQQISTLVPGATNAERAAVVGSLKYIAYLAIECPKSDKVDVNFNLTAIVKGRKVRTYTDESTYTTAYSANPAWCFLDFLTAYNGAKIGRLADGTLDDTLVAQYIDIQSLIDAAAHCDEEIGYDELTVTLTGDNNDLIWQSRASGTSGLSVEYINPGTPNAIASISYNSGTKKITVNLATNGSSAITTTANDIVSLVLNSATVKALVKVYNDDITESDGTGVVTAYSAHSFIAGTSTPRCAFNMIFDSKFSVYDVIEQFKLNCNGAFTQKSEKFQFKIDKAEDVVKVFTNEDIIQGSEEVKPLPLEERYDKLIIKIIDPDNEWSKVDVQAELETSNNESPVSHEVSILSVTSTAQGRRLAWHYLNRNNLCPYFGKFSTDYKAADLEVGDVIQIPVLVMDWEDYSVKVTSIIDDGSGVFDVNWRTYDANLYTDELGSQEITVNKITINPDEKLRAATFVVAASNSKNKAQADFICSGVDDQYVINSAIEQLDFQVIESGTVSAGSTKNDIILNNAESSEDDYYNGCYLRFTTGSLDEETPRLIQDYTGSTKTAHVEYEKKTVKGTFATINSVQLGGLNVSSSDDYYNGMTLNIWSVPSLTISDYDGATKTASIKYDFILAGWTDCSFVASNIVQLGADGSAVDDYYNGVTIYISDYKVANYFTVTDYDGATKRATLDKNFTAWSNYVDSNGLITFKNEFSGAASAGDEYEILQYSGNILLLDGKYKNSGAILPRRGMSLTGLGNGSYIEYLLDSSGWVYSDAAIIDDNYEYGSQDISISDLKIRGFGATQPPLGIETKGTVSNCYIQNFAGGINAAQIYNSKGFDCYQGLSISDNAIAQGNLVSRCDHAIYATGDNYQIVGNNCTNNNYDAIYANGDNVTVSNNVCNNNGLLMDGDAAPAITLYSNDSTINGNTANNNGMYGISVFGNDNTLSGNTAAYNCQDTAGGGLDPELTNIIVVGDYNNIQNNTARASLTGNNLEYGLIIVGNNNIVSNNDLKGSASYLTASLLDDGAGNTKNNNRT